MPGNLSVPVNVVLDLTLEVHLPSSVSTSKAVSSLLRGIELLWVFFPNSFRKTVFMIHFAEMLRIMTSTRHESRSLCKLKMHHNLDVAGSIAELCSLRCRSP